MFSTLFLLAILQSFPPAVEVLQTPHSSADRICLGAERHFSVGLQNGRDMGCLFDALKIQSVFLGGLQIDGACSDGFIRFG